MMDASHKRWRYVPIIIIIKSHSHFHSFIVFFFSPQETLLRREKDEAVNYYEDKEVSAAGGTSTVGKLGALQGKVTQCQRRK